MQRLCRYLLNGEKPIAKPLLTCIISRSWLIKVSNDLSISHKRILIAVRFKDRSQHALKRVVIDINLMALWIGHRGPPNES